MLQTDTHYSLLLLLLNIGENPTHAAYTEKPKILKVPGTFKTLNEYAKLTDHFNGIQKVSESCLCYNSFNFILALNKLIILYTYSIYAIEIYYSVHVLLAKTVHHVNYDLNNKFMYLLEEVVDDFDWGAYLREGEETYSTIYADSDVSFLLDTDLVSLSLSFSFSLWETDFL